MSKRDYEDGYEEGQRYALENSGQELSNSERGNYTKTRAYYQMWQSMEDLAVKYDRMRKTVATGGWDWAKPLYDAIDMAEASLMEASQVLRDSFEKKSLNYGVKGQVRKYNKRNREDGYEDYLGDNDGADEYIPPTEF